MRPALEAFTADMNYDRFFSDLGRSRQPSFLRQLFEDGTAAQKEPMDHLISLSGGIPSADTFPVKTISFELSDGKTVTLDEKTTAKCLQYGKSTGIEDLLGWLERILVKFHNPKLLHPQTTPSNGSRTKIVMTNGCQDAISKLFGALCSKGDTVLIEESVYAGCLAALRPHGVRMQTVKSTQGGIDVEDLERVLSKWSPKDVQNETSDSPKLMYVVPTGSNPTGQNLSLESKRKIYSLAQKYDFLIMEDDPYYFHNFEETAPPSFLSLDTDGRVIRLDSFSKIISPGMRLGFVSGPEAILNVLLYDIQSSGVHGNHLSQMMVLGLMENWGMEGFQKHVEKLCKTYKNRRDMCVRAAETHLKDLAEWSVPSGGFFLWLKLKGIKDSNSFIRGKVIPKGVICAPGCGFHAENDPVSSYVRISYSSVTEKEMNTALYRLAEAIREELDTNKEG